MESSEQTMGESRGTLAKLLRMGLPELACRGRQEAFKWVERVHSQAEIKRVLLGKTTFDQESLGLFLRNAEEHFFEGLSDPRVPAALAIGAAQHCTDVLAAADKICRGRFDLLGYNDLDFGSPTDWQLDPISGRRAPSVHWPRIDPMDHATVGDSKVIWELNRHQWLVQLGQAYRSTRDERYAEAAIGYLRSWVETNPPRIGINWTSSLEAAFRLISWCWTLLLIRDSPALTPDVFALIAESARTHACHIERYLSYYFSPNTHLTGEALGLLYAGVLFPELKHAGRWRSVAMRILVQQIERQVLSDGVYFERSTCYQRYTVDIYLHFLILASRSGLEIPPVVEERVRAMVDFLVSLRQPDGAMPNIGDADGGWLLPLSRTQPEDFRPMFSTAAVVFRSPEYAWAAGALAPETLWLLGTPAVEIFEALEPSPPPSSDACRVFPAGGFAVMRNGWDEKSHTLIFDAGPLGCPVSSGHGHADLLSIQCAAFGQPYLVDAGTCCYTANPELRDFSRGTAAHSTVMVDGRDHAQTAGPFAWQESYAAELCQWVSNETLTFADAEHDAYHALPDAVSHRRRVIFVRRAFWVIVDDLTGRGNHRVEVRFQFAPMDVRIDRTGWVWATRDDRHGLLMRAIASTEIDVELRTGQRNPLEGWISPNYGRLEPAPVAVYTANTSLPMRVVTLLWPTARIHDETPRVEVIRDRAEHPAGVVLRDSGETIVFNDGEPFIHEGNLS